MKRVKVITCICPEMTPPDGATSQGKETAPSWKWRENDRIAGTDPIPIGGGIVIIDGKDAYIAEQIWMCPSS